MSLPPESKPGNGTKITNESSDNFTMDVSSVFIKKDVKLEIANGNEELDSQCQEEMDEEKCYAKMESSSLDHCDSKSQEKQNKSVTTEQINLEDKNDNEKECITHGLKGKEMLEMENDLQEEIIHHEDVSSDFSNASSDNSSGIENDFESHEEYCQMITENEGEIIDNAFKDSSANHFHNKDDHSNRKEDEVSKNADYERKEQGKNNEDYNLKKMEGTVPSCNGVLSFDAIKFPYTNPANAFEVVVPLIGKNVMSFGDIKPFNQRYDLANEINRLKGLEDAPFMPKLSFHEWRKQRDARPQEEKNREARKKKFIAIKTAVYIIKITTKILQEMQKDNPDEKTIERWFFKFLKLSASPLSILIASQFVHVMMFIRGSSEFSQSLRYVADRCYWKCHVMFPIPDGYNFATVYTSEVVKNIPQQLNTVSNYVLDYGDFQCPFSEDEDSDDSAFSEPEFNEEV